MRSTFSTSAPNQASIWVQAGPACTPVKSMTLIPVSGKLVMMGSLSCGGSLVLFLSDSGGVEVGEVAALGAVGGIDNAIDHGRTARHQRVGERDGELGGRCGLVALAAESLDQAVMARVQHQSRRGRIRGYGVDPVPAVNPAVVEDDDDHGQPVAADGLQLHSAEPECTVAFDRHDRGAALDG